jgi:hypothetical protein
MIPLISALGTANTLPHLEELSLLWSECLEETPFPIFLDVEAWPLLRSLEFANAGLDTNVALVRSLLHAAGPQLQKLTLAAVDGYWVEGMNEGDLLRFLHVLGTDATISWRSSLTDLTLACHRYVGASPEIMFNALKAAFSALPNLLHLRPWPQSMVPVTVLSVVDTMARGQLRSLRELDLSDCDIDDGSLLLLHVWRENGTPRRVLRLTSFDEDILVGKWMARQQKMKGQSN